MVGLGFEGFHLLGEVPEGFIEADIAVDAFDGAGAGHALAVGFAFAVVFLSAFDEVFLNGVEGVPKSRLGIFGAFDGQELICADGSGGEVFPACETSGFGEHLALAIGKREGFHLADAVHELRNLADDFNAGFNDLRRIKTGVDDGALGKGGIANNEAIHAVGAEDAAVELVGAAAVVGIDENDFWAVGAGKLQVVTVGEADHVLLETFAGFVANVLLLNEGGNPAFCLHAVKDGSGREERIALAGAAVGCIGKDAGSALHELLAGERLGAVADIAKGAVFAILPDAACVGGVDGGSAGDLGDVGDDVHGISFVCLSFWFESRLCGRCCQWWQRGEYGACN